MCERERVGGGAAETESEEGPGLCFAALLLDIILLLARKHDEEGCAYRVTRQNRHLFSLLSAIGLPPFYGVSSFSNSTVRSRLAWDVFESSLYPYPPPLQHVSPFLGWGCDWVPGLRTDRWPIALDGGGGQNHQAEKHSHTHTHSLTCSLFTPGIHTTRRCH